MNILLTGGGTAGHVTPNLALIDELKLLKWKIFYIGSINGIEQILITPTNIQYYAISTGKLRRYFSWQNFIDIFKIIKGIWQAFFILKKLKINIVFSKGGFVAFPVVFSAWLCKIPIIIHESDLTVGLANRMSFPFANIICVPLAMNIQKMHYYYKMIPTGTPIRDNLFHGNKDIGFKLCNFNKKNACILILGGSQGANIINHVLRQSLDKLLNNFNIIHICGKGNIDNSLIGVQNYCQFEYVNEKLNHLFAICDLIISRAGANSLYEILALKKPNILIPLSMQASRGDQIHNAEYFAKKNVSFIIYEEELTPEVLIIKINKLYLIKDKIINNIIILNITSATKQIIDIIQQQIIKK